MATMEQNRDHMLKMEAAGTATDSHKAWLERYRAGNTGFGANPTGDGMFTPRTNTSTITRPSDYNVADMGNRSLSSGGHTANLPVSNTGQRRTGEYGQTLPTNQAGYDSNGRLVAGGAPTVQEQNTATNGMMQLTGRADQEKWERNRNFMLKKEAEGTATPEMQEWLERYKASGGASPADALGIDPAQAAPTREPMNLDRGENQEQFDRNMEHKQRLINNGRATPEMIANVEHYLESGGTVFDPAKQFEEPMEFIHNATGDGGKQPSEDEISSWWTQMNQLRQRDPAGFEAAMAADPEYGIKWYAWAATKNMNYDPEHWSGFSREEAAQRAQALAYQMSQDLGYGEDGKKDGKMIAFNFDQFKDIQRESGGGDWQKLGRPATTSESPFGEILNNPFVNIAAAVLAPVTGGGSVAGLEALKMANSGEISVDGVVNIVSSLAMPKALTMLKDAGLTATQAQVIYNAAEGGIRGEDFEEIVKGAGADFLLGTVNNGTDPLLSSDNVMGSFTKAAVNDAIERAVVDGDFDLVETLKAGAIKAGIDVAKDIGMDAMQTNSAQDMVNDGEMVNGVLVNPAEALRLEDTTDLHGLLGENGLFAKVGIDVGYLPTDWLGDAADFLDGYENRQTLVGPDGTEYTYIDGPQDDNVHDPVKDPTAGDIVLNPDGSINRDINPQDAINGVDGWSVNETTQEGPLNHLIPDFRGEYDERFFDITSERGTDTGIDGIHEKNPYATSDGTVDINTDDSTADGGGFEGNPLPGQTGSSSTSTVTRDGGGSDDVVIPGTNTTVTQGEITQASEDLEEEILSGNVGSVDDNPVIPGQTGSNTITRDPYADGEVDRIPGLTPDEQVLPQGPTGGGKGAPIGGGGSGMMAGGDAEWTDFMAELEVDFPLLASMNITPKQYLDMLFKRLS